MESALVVYGMQLSDEMVVFFSTLHATPAVGGFTDLELSACSVIFDVASDNEIFRICGDTKQLKRRRRRVFT